MLLHADGHLGCFEPGNIVTLEGTCRLGVVLASDDSGPTVLWSRACGAAFVCRDDTERLQRLVDGAAAITDQVFYLSGTVKVSKPIVVENYELVMLNTSEGTFSLSIEATPSVLQMNWLRRVDI